MKHIEIWYEVNQYNLNQWGEYFRDGTPLEMGWYHCETEHNDIEEEPIGPFHSCKEAISDAIKQHGVKEEEIKIIEDYQIGPIEIIIKELTNGQQQDPGTTNS